MDEVEFKRHLRDLAHGHHHPEEHDWQGAAPPSGPGTKRKPARSKTAAAKRKPAKKRR